MFKAVSGTSEFPSIEESNLAFWEQNGIFEKSLQNRKGNPEFLFYDGPPFATGLPHYGHILAGTIKDVIPRYQTMRGKYCERTFGWDCHGLPVEYEMEKQLKLSGKKEIEDYGIGKFNEACRGIVLRYTSEWETIVKRMGRWVDFRNGYRTMDMKYMESIWWVFRQLWDKGLIYEANRIQPYCPSCSSPLSNFEVNQGGREAPVPAITVRFRLKDEPGTSVLAWTTKPWTLPSNMALAMGPEIDYVKVKDGDDMFILAESRLHVYYRTESMPEILARFKGSEMAGRRYVPLFPFFADMEADGAFRIIAADFVDAGEGTGIAPVAPGFGEDDAVAGAANGVPCVCPIDAECRFTDDVPDYAGCYVKDADAEIIGRLRSEGKLVHCGIVMRFSPQCLRDDTPLIYRAVSSWFIRIDPIREKMVRANSEMNWVPSHIRNGRFGKWLESARDWAISRNRCWGCPMPVWRNTVTGETVCVGSVAELEKLTGMKVTDIHKHSVDGLTITTEKGTVLRRVPEILDCWFESGSMPFAQKHYPFEDREHFEECFPADFIAEGQDQIHRCFYTLTVLSGALFDKPPAKHVVVNGMVLAEDGQKMSRRLRGSLDPMRIVNTYGADSLRLVLLGSQVVRAEDLKFSESAVKEAMLSVVLPFRNAFSFFTTYANADGWEPAPGSPAAPEHPSNPLDRWILSRLADMVLEIRTNMDQYQIQPAVNRFESFVEDLTNWYIRLSRRRFRKSGDARDKAEAYATLYYVLVTFTKAAAPFIPFITEEIYRSLRTEDMPESVHLCDFPEPELFRRDERLERQNSLAQEAVSLGRFLRAQRSLKVRQPLARAVLFSIDPEVRELLALSENVIADELNVKRIEIFGDEELLVHLSAKANFRNLAPRLGSKMKAFADEIAGLSSHVIFSIMEGTPYELKLEDGSHCLLGAPDIVVNRDERPGFCVAADTSLTVALETRLNDELLAEGYARELVSRIQSIRKDMGLRVSDRIAVRVTAGRDLLDDLESGRGRICAETLASSLEFIPAEGEAPDGDLNGKPCGVEVRKI